MPLNRCLRVFQILGLFYVAVAVLYATNFLLVYPLCTAFSLSLNHWSPRWSIRSFLPSALSVEYVTQHYASHTNMNAQLFLPTNEGLEWSSSDASLSQGLTHNHDETASMPQDLFLSKAFSNSMRPTKVIPYFYRASGTFDRDDITITTLITSNRFLVFSRLVERYQGPISVTIHVRNTTTHLRKLFDSLKVLYASSTTMSTFVDVHLVVDSFDRQFNAWRNIARLFARTDFILMLDIDFSVCTDFRTTIRNDKKIMNKLREGRSAFVIPAFEYTRYAEGMDPSVFPRDKPTLMKLVNSKHLGMFHASWVPGHNSTDYKRYYAAPPGDVYKVSHYQSAYEPYVVFKKEGPPWCDERFIGYGGNKAACLFEMYLSGTSFYVLADHFIIHQNHLYEEMARKNERRYNRKIYSEFKEEICLRYLKSYYEMGLFNTTRGMNARQECKSVKGIAKTAAEIFQPL